MWPVCCFFLMNLYIYIYIYIYIYVCVCVCSCIYIYIYIYMCVCVCVCVCVYVWRSMEEFLQHKDVLALADKPELIYIKFVRTVDVAGKICRKICDRDWYRETEGSTRCWRDLMMMMIYVADKNGKEWIKSDLQILKFSFFKLREI